MGLFRNYLNIMSTMDNIGRAFTLKFSIKLKLAFLFLILSLSGTAQKVAVFGDAIHTTKFKTLYYRFDDEKFTIKQSIPIQMSAAYGKKFENDYRMEFDESVLRKHRFLYFSNVLTISNDSILVNQNRLNLTELFKSIDALPAREGGCRPFK